MTQQVSGATPTLSKIKKFVRHSMIVAASLLHQSGIFLIVSARKLVRLTERHTIDQTSDRFIIDLPALHKKVQHELDLQRREYNSYSYFHGYPYQSLGILQIFGERGTEERFDAYELAALIKTSDHVLDIGCNCGFMTLYSAFRTGCSADGIDINPYMIRIGQYCSEYLQLNDRVKLIAQSFLDYRPERLYSVVLSFATHWTDDKNYRVQLQDHLLRIHAMMESGGLLVFETHSADVGNPEFYSALEEMRGHFSWDSCRSMARGTRELYLMRQLPRPPLEGQIVDAAISGVIGDDH
jgi:SAM-dependent methyltransferase